MLSESLAQVITDDVRGIGHLPRCIACIHSKTVAAIGAVVALENQARHSRAKSIVENVAHWALSQLLWHRSGTRRGRRASHRGLARRIQNSRPGKRRHSDTWLRRQRDMSN